MKKIKIVVLAIVAVLQIFMLLPFVSSADYTKKVYKYIGGEGMSTQGISLTASGASRGVKVNDGESWYQSLYLNASPTPDRVTVYLTNASEAGGKTLHEGDILVFDVPIDEASYASAMYTFLQTYCVEQWTSNETSIYHSIFSTVSHYVFNDTFDNVPFGEFWVSGVSILATILLLVLPFLVVFWVIRGVIRR